METETIKRVISDQEAETASKFKAERIISRECDAEIQKYTKKANAVVISGPRRSGKSTAAILLVKDKTYARLNFDDPSLEGMKAEDLVKVTEAIYDLKGDVEYVILDEIQNIKGWELYVSRLRETKKVIVTGSNSNLMSEELASRLTGRYVSFTTFPFSFREFLDYSGFKFNTHLTKDVARMKKLFDEYLRGGGFPEALAFGSRFLAQIYNDIITKDIERRFNIRYRETFRELSRYLVSNISKEASYNKLKNIFNIKSIHTIRDYVGFLENAYLLFKIDKYSPKLKQQVWTNKKVYCIDTGIVNAMGFRADEEKGRLLENMVAVELLRRKYYWNVNSSVFYWQDYAHNEVDFVVRENDAVTQLIQVSYRVDDYDTKSRETKSLISASKELKCGKLLVLTYDYEGVKKFEGKTIKFIPAWRWLLEIGMGATD